MAPTRWLITSVLACCLAPLTGCGPERSLSVDSFAGQAGTAATGGPPRPTYSASPTPAPRPASVWASDVATITDPTPQALAGAPAQATPTGERPPLLLDAKVGDVNGRPLLASVFLEDLTPRLEALRRTAPSQAAWVAEARRIIADKVNVTVQDEVLYREGRSQLPEEVRQGLFTFVQMARQNIRRAYSGSEIAADQRLRQETGLGLDETLDLEKRQAVIGEVLRSVAATYPEPTWADVQNEYDRRYDEFNPPMRVFARIIMSPDTDAATEAAARLTAGEPFEQVASASSLNRYRARAGGTIDSDGREVVGDLADAEIVGIAELNQQLVALAPGEWAGPIEYGDGRTGFVMLDRIDQSRRSLEDGDLQLQLRADIQRRRLLGAQEEYIMGLLEAANLGAREQAMLTEQLLEVAYARVFGAPQ